MGEEESKVIVSLQRWNLRRPLYHLHTILTGNAYPELARKTQQTNTKLGAIY